MSQPRCETCQALATFEFLDPQGQPYDPPRFECETGGKVAGPARVRRLPGMAPRRRQDGPQAALGSQVDVDATTTKGRKVRAQGWTR